MRDMFYKVQGHSRAAMAIVTAFCVAMLIDAQGALAAADPTTGIDYKADIATPALDSAKPAVLAAVGILAFLVAVSLGRKVWHKASGN